MRYRFIPAAILAAIPLAAAAAAPSVRLTVPPPGRYGIEDLWKATVNSDTVCDAWFEGWVFEANHGQVFHVTTKPFRLTRGTKIYRYGDVTIDRTQTEPGYEVFVTRSGQLPQGSYSFKLILQPFGVGDSNRFEVKPMGPPRLISPPDGAKLGGPNPDFVWTPPTPTPREPVTYRLRLYEVLPGQTPEEAAASNPPWFEQGGIKATQLRYPMRARKLDEDKEYTWQVDVRLKPDFKSLGSELRRFKPRFRPQRLDPVTVTRRVEREQTRFKVYLDIKVNADIEDLVIRTWNTGFQCIGETDVSGGFGIEATDHTGTRTLKPAWYGDQHAGESYTLIYHAIPILVPDMFWLHWWALCDSVVITYRRAGQYYIQQPELTYRPMQEMQAAWNAADFLIVTRPERLYENYDGHATDALLATCGRLARKKNGVLGYMTEATSKHELRAMLRRNGTWGSLLAPAFRLPMLGGYVLLVGEQNIVPTWTKSVNITYNSGGSEKSISKVRLSDFLYSDCDNIGIANLVVGRAIGRSARELEQVVNSAVNFSTNAKPSSACFVSGYDKNLEVRSSFLVATAAGSEYLSKQGVNSYPWAIGMLPDNEKLSTLQKGTLGRNLISYFGHGNVGVWADVVGSGDVNSLGYANGTWVTAFSCLTGFYSGGGAICRAFTNKPGTLGYIGSTEVSLNAVNYALQSELFWSNYRFQGWKPGRALHTIKWVWSLSGSSFQKLACYSYNLYGCPK